MELQPAIINQTIKRLAYFYENKSAVARDKKKFELAELKRRLHERSTRSESSRKLIAKVEQVQLCATVFSIFAAPYDDL